MHSKLKSIKLFSLIGKEYLRRHGFLWFVLILISLSLILLFKIGLIDIRSATLTEGIVGTYQSHDLPETVTKLLSSSLTEFNVQGRVVPKLADSWDVNKEANEFKFKLKKGVQWADGTLLKSSDLEFTIPDVEISFPDDATILFKLKDSFVPFPSLLTKPIFKKGSILTGTGPYKLKKIDTSRIFITKLSLIPLKADLPGLFVRFYPNEKTSLTAFQLGEIQTLLGINDIQEFKNVAKVGLIRKTSFSKIVTILYNTKDPILSSRSLRQALSYSAPEMEGEEIAKTPFLPNSWVYNEDNIKDYLSNKDQANLALTRAKSNSGELLKKEIILTTTPQLEDVGKKTIKMWQELGLNAKLRVESGIPQNFQALLITQVIPEDPDQYHLWHSTQVQTNLSKYSSPRVDKDLEDGRKTISEEERKIKYMDFQKVLMEDAPATFLYFPKYNIIYQKRIEGLLSKILPIQLPN